MRNRNLRVVKWLGQIPAIGVCTLCERRFTVPMTALTSEAEARKSLELQFVVHQCEYNDESRRKAFARAGEIIALER